MNPSNHPRSPLARLTLAAGGIGTLFLTATLAHLAADVYGTLAGVLVAGLVFGGCGLAFRPRTRRAQPQRPAPVRLPEPAADDLEPVNTAA